MNLSIIFVNYNVFDDICVAIDSIQKNTTDIDYEIIVVDSSSSDRAIDKINEKFPEVIYLPLQNNYGFGYANNRAMEIAKGKYFLLMNPDIIVQDNSIRILFDYLSINKDVGMVGPVQVKLDNKLERYYCFFPSIYSRFMQELGFYKSAPGMRKVFINFWDNNILKGIPFEVDWIIGSCMLIKREIFEVLGGFEEAFFLYEEEVDWQLRMSKAGWRRVILPNAKVIHKHSSSAGKIGLIFVLYQQFRSRIIFLNKNEPFFIRICGKLFLFFLLGFKIIINAVFYLLTLRNIKKNKIILNLDLLSLLFKTRKQTLMDRFDPNKYKGKFT